MPTFPPSRFRYSGEVQRLEQSDAVKKTSHFVPWISLIFVAHCTCYPGARGLCGIDAQYLDLGLTSLCDQTRFRHTKLAVRRPGFVRRAWGSGGRGAGRGDLSVYCTLKVPGV